jgi:hypothetical protein
MTDSISAASATVRVSGPWCVVESLFDTGHMGTRPYDGLWPTTPQKPAGMRIEPAPSEPWWSGPKPKAAEAAAPELEPPGVMFVFHGLRLMPVSGLSPSAFQPNSGVVVLPTMMAPASRRRRRNGGSWSGTRCSKIFEPNIDRTPFISTRSLIVTGTPWRAPRASPRMIASSARFASAIAVSARSVHTAFTAGFRRSMRSRTARVTSTGDIAFVRSIVTSSVAGV